MLRRTVGRVTTPRLQPLSPDRAKRVAWGLSATATAAWAAAVAVSGTWGRVLDNWESALTMLFGSFLAGSSPEGGGAVAFPVFTKVLDVPGAVARTFGLSIQAVGMTMAVAAIVLYRRPIERTALAVAVPTAIAGFGVGLMAFANTSTAFWPATFAAGWVKATFSIVLATTSILMMRRLRRHETSADQVPWQPAVAVRQHGCEAWLVECKVDVEVCWAGLSPGG